MFEMGVERILKEYRENGSSLSLIISHLISPPQFQSLWFLPNSISFASIGRHDLKRSWNSEATT